MGGIAASNGGHCVVVAQQRKAVSVKLRTGMVQTAKGKVSATARTFPAHERILSAVISRTV